MNTTKLYTPADIKELLGGFVLIKNNFSKLYNEETFNNIANGLLEVMVRMSIQITDNYNVVITGLSSSLDNHALMGPTQLALSFDKNNGIEQAVEVTDDDHQTIQDAVTIIDAVPSDNSITDREKSRLVNKLKRGRAMDFRDVVSRYMSDKPDIIGNDLLSLIEQETGVGNAFNGLRRTAANIAICRYPVDNTGKPLQTNAKYPGYVDAQNFIISNFKLPDDKTRRKFANSVLQNALQTYAPDILSNLSKVREDRQNKRLAYTEKGYPAE